MADLVRESPIGQVIRFVTRNKYLRYPEEIPGFQIPWGGVANAPVDEKPAHLSDGSTHGPGGNNIERDAEKDMDVGSLARKTTTRGTMGTALGPVSTISRTRTREQTLPYSAERFETELEEQAERLESTVIVPQKTADGITLVDWYTTDE